MTVTNFTVKFEDLIFTREGNSEDLLVTGKNGVPISGDDTSVTIENFKNNDIIYTSNHESGISIKENGIINVTLDTSTNYDYNNPYTPYMALADYKENISLIRSITSNYLNAYILGLDEKDTISLDTEATYDVLYGNGTDYNHRMLHILTSDKKSLYVDGYFEPVVIGETEISSSGFYITVGGNVVDLSKVTLDILSPQADFDAKTFLENVPFNDVVIGTNTMQNRRLILKGGDGNDVINSQFTSTTMYGGAGADTFRYDYSGGTKYTAGHGNDVIKDAEKVDNITFINSEPSEFSFNRSDNNLKITSTHVYNWVNTNVNPNTSGQYIYNDSITLEDFFIKGDDAIDDINFVKGDETKKFSLLKDSLINVELSDNEYAATKYSEKISGVGTVTNLLDNDILSFANETINSRNGNDLTVSDGTGEITVADYFKNGQKGNIVIGENEVVTLKSLTDKDASLHIIDANTAANKKGVVKGSSIAESIIGSSKNNTIKGGGGDDIIDAFAGKNKVYTQTNIDDSATVYSGLGSDTLYSGLGTDFFVFGKNHGHDTVVVNSKAKIGSNVILDFRDTESVKYSEKGNNLIISTTFTRESGAVVSESVTVKDYLKGKSVDYVNISVNGEPVANLRDLLDAKPIVLGNFFSTKKQKITGSFLNEMLTGGSKADVIKGKGGIDTIYGAEGKDKLYGFITSEKVKSGNKTKTIYHYDDVKNAKNFLFSYDYAANYGDGDGKDTIYNGKVSDRISLNIDADAADADNALAKLLNDLTFKKSKKNLVIDYAFNDMKKGKPVASDSITVSNYYKLNAETQALRYVDLTTTEDDGTVKVLGTLDLAKDVVNGAVKADVKSNILNSTVYNISDEGVDEVRKDNLAVFGNDTYNITRVDSALTKIFDGHGNDVYNTDLEQFVYINDTDGKDVLNLTSTGSVKMFFDVTSEGAQGSMFFVDSNNVGETVATGSVEVANWFGGKSENMSVFVEGNMYDMSSVDAITSNVQGWLTNNTDYSSAKAAFDAVQGGTAVQNFNELLQCYYINPTA